jgi:hypothetical protein
VFSQHRSSELTSDKLTTDKPGSDRLRSDRLRSDKPGRDRLPGDRRRIRRQARDSLSAAAVSLAGSVAMTVVIWALVRWLG